MWTKVTMFTKRPISDMTVSVATTRTPEGRTRGHIRPTYENQNHGERKHSPCCICTRGRNSCVRDATTS